MCDFLINLFTSEIFLTIISGVLVFVIGQLFNEYFLKPIQDYKKLRGKIAYTLTFYAQLYMNPIDILSTNNEYNSASYEIRKLAAEVDSLIETKPLGNLFIPKIKTLVNVSKCLIAISNNFYSNNISKSQNDNALRRSQIYSLLKMKSHSEKKH